MNEWRLSLTQMTENLENGYLSLSEDTKYDKRSRYASEIGNNLCVIGLAIELEVLEHATREEWLAFDRLMVFLAKKYRIDLLSQPKVLHNIRTHFKGIGE